MRLEPLSEAHVAGLAKVGLEPEIWRYMRYGKVESEADIRTWVQELLALQAQGTDLPFAVIQQSSGEPLGCTRYLHIDPPNRSLEIGGTWYGLAAQGSLVNTECKYLLLRHAFETLHCIRVWFKADARNQRSLRALEKIGAVKEGVLRNHMILPDGFIRHSVMFSLLPEEWPGVKTRLEGYLSNSASVGK